MLKKVLNIILFLNKCIIRFIIKYCVFFLFLWIFWFGLFDSLDSILGLWDEYCLGGISIFVGFDFGMLCYRVCIELLLFFGYRYRWGG